MFNGIFKQCVNLFLMASVSALTIGAGVPVMAADGKEPVDWVDPLLGTSGSRWMLFPGPSMPFGMVKLSPDNECHEGWYQGGHEYSLENIAGFSHVHSWTMGGLLTMPATGPLKIVPGPENDPDKGYRSRYSHDQETASVGYYAVTLEDYGIRAELTTTTRAGFQRYTFPKAKQARILFDLNIPTEGGVDVIEAKITKVSDTQLEGYVWQRRKVRSSKTCQEYVIHFVAEVNKPFASFGGWRGAQVSRSSKEIASKGNVDVGGFISFSTDDDEVIMLKTGISYVSIAQARLNLQTEMSRFGWDFDAARNHARKTWNDLLGTIEVEGGTDADKTKFYTNLYRSYCARTIFSDANGQYVDMYEKVQQLKDPDSPVYGCDAFWGTQWNLIPLWTLVTPDLAGKWVRSLLEIRDRGGWLPKGPGGIEYTAIMVASREIALIVSAYQKGIRDFDVEKAYRAIRRLQMEPGRPHEGGGYVGNRDLKVYMELGYVPVGKGHVSNTLDYAYDDWCLAQLAKALGKDADYEYFIKRSRNYENIFDPSVGYMRQRHADGTWFEEFDPFTPRHDFVEGTPWQFTFFVPHDVKALVKLLGRDRFIRRLDEGFRKSRPFKFATGYAGIECPINQANQPNMQAAYLFNYADAPWLTQKWSREITDRFYGTGPVDGYPHVPAKHGGQYVDEDQGQLGAWFVMSAMGLFEMDGGAAVRPTYDIGSPIFDRVTIHLDKKYYPGGQFVIEARNNSKENVYIQSATLDGQPLNKPWFYHSQLADGGKLILQLGPEPNKQWGVPGPELGKGVDHAKR